MSNSSPSSAAGGAAASSSLAEANSALVSVQYSGFGSFHSDDVEHLVRLPDADYVRPALFPTWALTYPNDDELGFLAAFSDAIEAQDCSAAANSAKASQSVLSAGLPTRRSRDQNQQHDDSNNNNNNNHNNNNTHIEFGAPVSRLHFSTDTVVWCFVNHGAFGGALRGGTLIKRRFEDLMERQLLQWVDRSVLPNIVFALRSLATFLNCRAQDLVPASNATLALNAAIKTCIRHQSDVVAYLDLEYGSVWKMMREAWHETKCTVHEIELYPFLLDERVMGSDQALTDLLEEKLRALGPKVDVFVVDHVTSNAALLLPVFSHFIPMLKRNGVKFIVVDGAHGALQFPLDFAALREEQLPTFYAGNLHKWVSTPKGAGFMWVHPSMQARTHSPIISHGARVGMLSEFVWEGTKEYGSFLTVPAILDFWQRRSGGVQRVRDYCSSMLARADALLCRAFDVRSVPRGAPFMRLVPLPSFFHPKIFSPKFVQDTLHFVYRCEVPVKRLEPSTTLFLRTSAFIYNSDADFVRLRDTVLRMRACFRKMYALSMKRKLLADLATTCNNNNNCNNNCNSRCPSAAAAAATTATTAELEELFHCCTSSSSSNNSTAADCSSTSPTSPTSPHCAIDPVILLTALAELIAAVSREHQKIEPPVCCVAPDQNMITDATLLGGTVSFYDVSEEEMHDASPLPFFDHLMSAFVALENWQEEQKEIEKQQENEQQQQRNDENASLLQSSNRNNNNKNSNDNHGNDNDDDDDDDDDDRKIKSQNNNNNNNNNNQKSNNVEMFRRADSLSAPPSERSRLENMSTQKGKELAAVLAPQMKRSAGGGGACADGVCENPKAAGCGVYGISAMTTQAFTDSDEE